MRHWKRLMFILLTSCILSCGSMYAGGINFGPIQAVQKKVDEYREKKLKETASRESDGYTALTLLTTIGSAGTGNGQFNFNSYATLCSTGPSLYVCDNGNNRIQKFDTNNNFISWFGTIDGTNYGFFTTGVPNNAFEPLIGPSITAKGHIFVLNNSLWSTIIAFDGQGVVISSYAVSGWSDYCADKDDNVYMFKDYNTIEKYNITGTLLTSFGGFGTSDGKFNNGTYMGRIVADSHGNIYVTDCGNHRVQKFDSNGNFLTSWSDDQISGRHMMCIANDVIYVGSYIKIHAYDTNGTMLKKYEIDRSSVGNMSYQGLFGACIQDNKLYVGDDGNNRILVFSIFLN